MSETDASEDSQGSDERILLSEPPQSPEPSKSQDPLHSEAYRGSEKGFRHKDSFPLNADPSTPALRSDQQVTLQVGERRFTTTKDTLTCGSHYFARMLSGRWPCEAQDDGSYFVDADGTIFEHTLRYLRHNVLPLYYDRVKGHDFGLYAALLEQARFFGVDDLEKWLRNKKYFEAVRTEHRVWLVDDSFGVNDVVRSDVELEYHPSWITERVYVCPRGITVHRGNPDACGRACKSARGDADEEYVKEQELRMVAIEKKTIFVQEICFQGSEKS
ncbi:hypothetical protein MMC17_002642 [Xylographa soralifera]|nr:hypothetical protein [Xylographa soralifera]